MKIEVFSYDSDSYGNLDDAQEDGAIHLIIRAAGALDLSSLKIIKETFRNTTKAFTQKRPALFIKMAGLDFSYEAVIHEFDTNEWSNLSEMALFYQNENMTSFERVRASITWRDENSEPTMVTIANSKNYTDLETCKFCGKCDNCKVDDSYFYYVDNLEELDKYLDRFHHDGWSINYYSVQK